MHKDNQSNLLSFKLIPIGKTEVLEGRTYLHILPDFKQALKYLEQFSHAIIFIEKHGTDYYEEIELITSRILGVDGKKGIVAIDNTLIKANLAVFDIKPYFPCEDRVKDVKLANSMGICDEWRYERTVTCAEKSNDVIVFDPYAGNSKNYGIDQIGIIMKDKSVCYLKLDSSNAYIIDQIQGYSHLRVLWWFNRFDKSSYRRITECNPPYENAPRTGIFASRSPVRPNPIALTTVRVLHSNIDGGLIEISPIDAFDNTPIIGIKPYIPATERVKEFYVPEWLKHWPEWVDDRDSNRVSGKVEVVVSDLIKIKNYLQTNPPESLVDKDFFNNSSITENMLMDYINVVGARQNNLKNITCKIPKNKMTVITGVSGSGKSSLAFDTVFAESQRRFMDSMTVAGRALFEQLDKPDFDQITGLPPAIAIEQKSVGRNPRSTVGTMTDIYDYLRLLFARIGTRHCPECGRAITPLKTDEIVDMLARLLPGTAFSVYPYKSMNTTAEFTVCECLGDDKNKIKFKKRLKESVTKALSDGNGAIEVNINDTEVLLFQTKEICYHCNRIKFSMTTSTFSFNNPESMCPVCKGLGATLEVDPELIVSNPELSILDGASAWWGNLRKHREKPNANWMKGEVLALAEEMQVDLELPWKALPDDFRTQALFGSNGREVQFTYKNSNGRKGEIVRPAEGAYNAIKRLFVENNGETASKLAKAFMRENSCRSCQGERLTDEGRLVEINGTRFPETMNKTIDELREWLTSLPERLSKNELTISGQILKDLKRRLENLIDVGLPYLTLNRSVPSLSGGEAQRLRLATQFGSGITNILYVLDEPSTGLHPKDHGKLIKMIQKLKNLGNTIVIVEHDADTMLAADKIIDMGPGAGIQGGQIICEGSPDEIKQNQQSDTGRYLKSYKRNSSRNGFCRKHASEWIKLCGARHNNLKNIDVSIPLGVLTCVTGVSGSGKSSLITKTLYPALMRLLNKTDDVPGEYDSLVGAEKIDQIISVSQQPIGRTPRSNPATYTGVFDEIRSLFATLDESKQKGYKQNKFSFNSKEGQCEACNGEGRKCVEMHFMPDVWVECPVCHGKRFNSEALEIKYQGKTIADVLEMDVEDALDFFKEREKIAQVLQTLYDVGLGYLKLGQSALTLSGGEAQRIKLAKELSKVDTGKTIYLLDEPTTGLHFSDVQNLLFIFNRITQAGNSVLIIEHNPDVIKNADWLIDLGPEGGSAGGYVIAQGTPEDVSKVKASFTGQCLKEILLQED